MMALNIAVPLTTVGSDLMDGFGLLSPISPLSVDCGGVVVATTTPGSHGKGKQQMVSPVGSESSGVSSLDSDEIKKPTSPPTTPTEEVDRPTTSSPIPMADATIVQQQDSSIDSAPDSPSSASSSSSSSSSARSSLSSTSSSSSSDSDSGSSSDQDSTGTTEVIATVVAAASADLTVEEEEHALLAPELPPKECKLVLGGRDVLNLMDNLTAPNHFRLQFAQLPENDNIHFFLDNRSQYHRLGANGHIQEYTMVGCKRCDFRYPVNGTSFTSAGPTATMGQNSLAAAFQQQQQQQPQPQPQPQPQQWNLNSISNSRDKMSSLNAAAAAVNAFNKTFGGGSQYFRNGSGGSAGAGAAAGLFGRDSNRQGAANFLNASSTGNSYNNNNNHKTYQQQQSKFAAAQFGSYQQQHQQQQHQQQQQQFFPKNHQMRYGGQSSAAAAAAAAVATLANQNLINFNSFGTSKNSANNNNMFAYYKTMM